MYFLFIIYRYLKAQAFLFVRIFYNLWQISKVRNVISQKIDLPIIVRINNGNLIFEGLNNIGKNSSLVCNDNNSTLVLKGDVMIGEDVTIFTEKKMIFEQNIILGSKCIIFAKNNNLVFNSGFVLGENSKVNISGRIDCGKNVIIGSNSSLFVQGNWIIKDGVAISSHVIIGARENNVFGDLYLGEGSQIGPNSIVDLCDDVYLGKGAIVGPNCVLYTHNHNYNDVFGQSLGKTSISRGKILIGRNTWIGCNVIILPGVEIGENVVIGAGSVVTKSIKSNCVAAGVPANVIKQIEFKA